MFIANEDELKDVVVELGLITNRLDELKNALVELGLKSDKIVSLVSNDNLRRGREDEIPKTSTFKESVKSKNIKLNFSKDELYDLYWNQKLGSGEIAVLYKCSPTDVINDMKKYNIPRRSYSEAVRLRGGKKWFVDISKDELIELYVNQNLTGTEIGIKYDCPSYKINELIRKYGITKK